ncbi:serine/arginine-rich splicing factor 11 isoform X4 [Artibeus jamaicensis]|uniref:serine/arginine-rich splicing factor 11 isoform X4 n=1 Tax=Artibeus jamaicensis TaxID=9417 RepID=UPI00235AB362|nr:serine/arginine-rich splicing factor 11 isoform X4 [Artibeus jamaicensis]
MSNTTVVPSTAGPGPSGGPGGGGGGGVGGGGTEVIQVTNVSPSASSEQMRTLFGFLGKIDELRLFPPDDSPLPVSSRVCFVKFHDPDSAVVAQHLTNTVFVDRALIVVPYAEGVIPDETKALSLLAPANAVAGLLPGGGLLPTPNPLTQIGAVPLAALGAPTLDPALAALGLPGANLNSQSLAADQLLKLMSTVDPKLNHVAAGLVSPSLKSDTSSKEIEEAMKRVREAQSLISAAIEPDKKEEKRRHSRSRSRSRRRRTPSSSRHRRSRSRSRRRSHSKSRSRRRSKSPRRRRSHSRERGRRSRSTSKTRDKKKEDKEKKRSKTPPKSYSTARRSRSASRERRRRRSRSGTRSPKKPRSPKRKLSRSPSPRRTFYCYSRHKKEKKKDKDKERGRDERERSTSKKKKSKEKEKDRERKSESDKDVKQVTRDYDEEEQGYDSEKEKKEEKKPTETGSPKTKECSVEKGTGDALRESKVNGDDHHEEDMDMSD